MRYLTLFLAFFLISLIAGAQDTLLLINGKELIADSIRTEGYSVSVFSTGKRPEKPRSIDGYRVFSIRHADGKEEVLYQKDPYDPTDFEVEEMRMFIKGEQDASRYYHDKLSTGMSVAIGAGASALSVYGLVFPPLYSTILGSFTPDMNEMRVSDETLRLNESYCEGYQSKVRKKKINNSLIGGLAGFAAGFITLILVSN